MPPVRPNFLVIGAQKCATSWLFRHLSAHPDIFMPPVKETAFFAYESHLQAPGTAAYFDYFRDAGTATAVGEATPAYFWSPGAPTGGGLPDGFQPDIPAAVRELLRPDVRLLLCLRDPARRALSAWAHYVAHGELDPDTRFRDAMAYGGAVAMGYYAHHLAHWRRCFPAAQFRVMTVEADIRPRPAKTLRDVARFLGVDPDGFPETAPGTPVFAGTRIEASGDGGIRFFPPADDPERRIPVHGATADELHWLRSLYRDDIVTLGRMLDRDFASTWGYGNTRPSKALN